MIIRVPATSANLGPGFDAIGMAFQLYNTMQVEKCVNSELSIDVQGEGSESIPTNKDNIVYRTMCRVFEIVDYKNQGYIIKMTNHIPLARGLGSSAAAIVGGLVAANAISGNKLSLQELLKIGTDIEGHPDNVAPALLGGITVASNSKHTVDCIRLNPPVELNAVVAVPDFRLSTHASREVLPKTVPFQDAVFNVGKTALLVAALATGSLTAMQDAMQDKLHQPYRASLIPGIHDVFDAAMCKGALSVALSGAGPCLIAFCNTNETLIGNAMIDAFSRNNIQASFLTLKPDTKGATVEI